MHTRRRVPWWGWIGAGTFLAGVLGLFLQVRLVGVLFYCIAWWSYILLADAWVWRRRGGSLLGDRPWEFAVLTFWSIPFWNLFELFNLRLQNWFYVNVPASPIAAALLNQAAYATVLPGLVETAELLAVLGFGDRLRMRAWRIQTWGLGLSAVIGAGMLIAPLLWPHAAFPLVWGCVIFLGDPVCYRAARGHADSLLGHLERGDPSVAIRFLAAGAICGGLWELWNFWAHTKWLYTVPFFDTTKWFEMPPLGFLGFPPFALEALVFLNLLAVARGGRRWDRPSPPGGGGPLPLTVVAIIAALLFNLGAYRLLERHTVLSTAPTLQELVAVAPAVTARLAARGLHTPSDLLAVTESSRALVAFSREAGVPLELLHQAREAARLADLKGLGAYHANALRRLGLTRLEDLAAQQPEILAERWREAAPDRPPTSAQVRLWIRAARRVVGLHLD